MALDLIHIRDIAFWDRVVLGSGTIQYYFPHISGEKYTLKIVMSGFSLYIFSRNRIYV